MNGKDLNLPPRIRFNTKAVGIPLLLTAIVIVCAWVFSGGRVSLGVVTFGALVACVGGAAVGILVATFLARGPKATDSKRAGSNPSGSREGRDKTALLPPRVTLTLQDQLDALPDIHRDHVRVAGMYGVVTVGDLANANPEVQSQLREAFGTALFRRSYKIAQDCARLGTPTAGKISP